MQVECFPDSMQVATTLERQAVDLEAAAHPALDELTANVSAPSSICFHAHHLLSTSSCSLRWGCSKCLEW